MVVQRRALWRESRRTDKEKTLGRSIDALRHVLDSAEIARRIPVPFLEFSRRGITLKKSR